MKNTFKLFLTLEPPFGEAWLVLLSVVVLLLFRLIDFNTALGWIVSAFFLMSIFVVGYLIKVLWNRYFNT